MNNPLDILTSGLHQGHLATQTWEANLQPSLRVLVVVEGQHDIEFLRRLSERLNAGVSSVPRLAAMEARGELLFLPTGGGDLRAWSRRLAPLRCAEFHLYDREQLPETELRRQAIAAVRGRPNCHATLTTKRTLENYLHPTAIQLATGTQLQFTAEDDVAALLARERFQSRYPAASWDGLSLRSRKRLTNRAKRVLNRQAVEWMSPTLLEETGCAEEVYGWYRAIQRLADLP